MKGIHIFLADGFEESEALVTLDILRRAGLEASTVTLPAEEVPQPFVTGSHGVTVVADMIWEDFADEVEQCYKKLSVIPFMYELCRDESLKRLGW